MRTARFQRFALRDVSNGLRRSRSHPSIFPRSRFVLVAFILACANMAHAAAPAPPLNLEATDRPNDRGNGIVLTWQHSPDFSPDTTQTKVLRYEVLRRLVDPASDKPATGFDLLSTTSKNTLTDNGCKPRVEYWYQVQAVGLDGTRSVAVATTTPMTTHIEWFNFDKGWYGLLLLFVCGAVGINIALARGGRKLWLRPIPAMQAVDEAVGRATEMGRPCLFIAGIADVDEMPTIAGITVLSRVARTAAEYDAKLLVPMARSLAMAAARETAQASYLAAGRPEAWDPDSVYYLTDDQFSFASAVAGTMARERPAACFYFGQFYAESLFLAETGQSVGAMQIAGTNETTQLPFFVAACDYVLIGEEFFAASAYLSGEPQQLGSIKGQDIGKLLAAALIIVGIFLTSFAALTPEGSLPRRMAGYVVDEVLKP